MVLEPNLRQYYVLSLDPEYVNVITFIRYHGLDFSAHLNRTRFTVPEGPILTEFLLRYANVCTPLDPSLDLTTGLPILTPSD
jgi:hypothetical protein